MKKYPINVAIADDNAMMLSSIVSTLNGINVFKVTCIATNGEELLEKIKSNPPHVVIVSYHMPELNGIQTIQKIKKLLSGVRIIGITSTPSILKIASFYRAGVDAVLTNNNQETDLIDAIVHLYDKGLFHNEYYYQYIRHMAEKKQPGQKSFRPWLAIDEMDLLIIQMIYYEELTHEEIAQKLKYISRKAIDQRVEKMTKTLNCKRFIGVIRICIENKILSRSDDELSSSRTELHSTTLKLINND